MEFVVGEDDFEGSVALLGGGAEEVHVCVPEVHEDGDVARVGVVEEVVVVWLGGGVFGVLQVEEVADAGVVDVGLET